MPELKAAFILIVFLSAVPISLIIRRNPLALRLALVAIGLLPFTLSRLNLDVGLFPIETDVLVSLHSSSLEFTAIDFLALLLYLCVPHRTNTIPFHFCFFVYILAILPSILLAEDPTGASYYLWRVVRIFFIVAVIAKVCTDINAIAYVLAGMAIGVMIQVPAQLFQLIVEHEAQPPGTFKAQNLLGVVLHLVYIPFLSLLLAGQQTRPAIMVIMFAVVAAALTASRGALLFMLLGIGMMFVISITRKFTPRKLALAGCGVVFIAAVAPIAVLSFQQRLETETRPLELDDLNGRGPLNEAAIEIIQRHAFGVGPNSYTLVAKTEGYSTHAGVVEKLSGQFVHNSYLLIAAESGYLGLLGLIVLLAYPIYVAFAFARRSTTIKGDLLMGLGVALLLVCGQSALEPTLVASQVQYLLALAFGMIFGLAHNVKKELALGFQRTPETVSVPRASRQPC